MVHLNFVVQMWIVFPFTCSWSSWILDLHINMYMFLWYYFFIVILSMKGMFSYHILLENTYFYTVRFSDRIIIMSENFFFFLSFDRKKQFIKLKALFFWSMLSLKPCNLLLYPYMYLHTNICVYLYINLVNVKDLTRTVLCNDANLVPLQ